MVNWLLGIYSGSMLASRSVNGYAGSQPGRQAVRQAGKQAGRHEATIQIAQVLVLLVAALYYCDSISDSFVNHASSANKKCSLIHIFGSKLGISCVPMLECTIYIAGADLDLWKGVSQNQTYTTSE